MKEERGHEKEGIIPFWFGGKQIYRCPLMLITPLSWEYIKAFSLYEKGYLPNGNCWLDESDKYIQAMIFLSNTFDRVKQKEQDGRSKPKHSPKTCR